MDVYWAAYADFLLRIGAWKQRAEFLKCVPAPTATTPAPSGPGSNKQQPQQQLSTVRVLLGDSETEMQLGVDFVCQSCGKQCLRGTRCNRCRKNATACVICDCPVKGLSTFCLLCYHGGHSQHLRQWFSKQRYCPSGCGCQCSLSL